MTGMLTWKKTFVSAFVAQVLSMVGFSFTLPFLPFFVAELGVTDRADQAWWAGIVFGSAGLTLALFAPVWGYLADRFGRKSMVVRAMFGGTLVLLLMSYVQTVGQLVVCRLLQGALTGTVAASVALVASVSPAHRSGFALGMMQTAVFLGVSLGPFVGGVVADHFGYRYAFRAGAVLVFLGGLLIWRGTDEQFQRPEVLKNPAPHERFAAVLQNPAFLSAVFVLFSIRFGMTLSHPSFPLIVQDLAGATQRLNSLTGAIVATAALAGAVSSGILGHFGDAWGHRRVLIACSVGAGTAALGHAFAQSLGHLFAARILFGLSVAGMIPAANALIRCAVHDRHIGKAYGAATALSMMGVAIGPVLGGYIGRSLGLRAPFVATAIAQLAVVAVACIFVRGGRTSQL